MPDRIDFGLLEVAPEMIVRQLRQDMRDDWYPDSLGYEDVLTPNTVAEAITGAIEGNNGLFPPERRIELNIPKKGFVLRYSLETSIFDRAYYHSLVQYLAPLYDELLPGQVLSHRHAGSGQRAGRYLFLHPIEQWKLFEGYVAQEMASSPVVLVTDIQNYYENINISYLVEILRRRVPDLKVGGADKAKVRTVIDELERCLREWCYMPSHGLPQNRDASSFLANSLLLPVDTEMLRRGYKYYRYMDDIKIATTSRYRARAALQDLIVELRKLGLNVNAAKTEILEPGMPGHQALLLTRNTDLEQIDSMWRSRSLTVIRRSFAPLRRLASTLIREGRTQERAFRFCVQRFENLALCSEIDVPDDFFRPLIEVAIQELDTQPCSTDQLVRFLKAAPASDEHVRRVASFLTDHDRAIYDWQNYLLWQLLVYKKYLDNDLLGIARRRICQPSLLADRAGSMLYLGAMGTDDDRIELARVFDTCRHHLLQRNALIAMHELDYNAGIKEYVVPHVLNSVKGSYKRIRQRFRGCYHRPLPAVSYLDIYDEVTSYE